MSLFNNQLWMTKVSECLADIYHQSVGSNREQQQTFTISALQRLLRFKAAYWLVCSHNGETQKALSWQLDANTKRRLDRAFTSQKIRSQLSPGRFGSNGEIDSVQHFGFLNKFVDKTKGLPLKRHSIISGSNNQIHLLILFNLPENYNNHEILNIEFIFGRVLHSLKLCDRIQYKSNRLRPNSYKAICDKEFNVLEAETNFYKLLRELSPEFLQDNQFVGKLKSKLREKEQFVFREIVYTVTREDDYSLVEVYFDDPRMRNITGKKLEIISLLYLEREEIAKRLNMKVKSLDSHLGAIYDEFGTREKKKILAETHYFPDFSKRKRLTL